MMKLGKILVVDEDKVSNYILVKVLRLMPVTAKLTVAVNGQEALELLRKESFDLLLVDIDMPGMEGLRFLDTLEQLQQVSLLKVPALVVLYTSVFDSEKVQATPFAIQGSLEKPFTKEKISTLFTSLQPV